MKPGRNEVVVLDLTGPESPTLVGVKDPVLDQLKPEKDFGSTADTQTAAQ